MTPSSTLEALRSRVQAGDVPGLGHLRIQAAELEAAVDSFGEVGLRAWIVIEVPSEQEQPTRDGTSAAAAVLAEVARSEGYEGFCDIVYASPEQAERLPSRRAGAAA